MEAVLEEVTADKVDMTKVTAVVEDMVAVMASQPLTLDTEVATAPKVEMATAAMTVMVVHQPADTVVMEADSDKKQKSQLMTLSQRTALTAFSSQDFRNLLKSKILMIISQMLEKFLYLKETPVSSYSWTKRLKPQLVRPL